MTSCGLVGTGAQVGAEGRHGGGGGAGDRNDGERGRAVLGELRRRALGQILDRRLVELALVCGEQGDGDRRILLGQFVAQLGGQGAVRTSGHVVGRLLGPFALAEDTDDESSKDQGQEYVGPADRKSAV